MVLLHISLVYPNRSWHICTRQTLPDEWGNHRSSRTKATVILVAGKTTKNNTLTTPANNRYDQNMQLRVCLLWRMDRQCMSYQPVVHRLEHIPAYFHNARTLVGCRSLRHSSVTSCRTAAEHLFFGLISLFIKSVHSMHWTHSPPMHTNKSLALHQT